MFLHPSRGKVAFILKRDKNREELGINALREKWRKIM